MKIGFIGTGNMAAAMIKGIIKSHLVDPEKICGSNRTLSKLNELAEETGITACESNIEVAARSNIIILSVKPDSYKKVIEEIRDAVTDEKIIVTIAAGMEISTVKEMFGKEVKVVRTMPNLPVTVSEGMSGVCPCDLVSDSEAGEILKIFSSFGWAEVIEEKHMNTVSSVAGSSPALVAMFIESLADAAVLKGLSRNLAYKIISQAVLGSAKMIRNLEMHPGELKDMVCSPGGSTIEAVTSLEKDGFRGSVSKAAIAAIDKTEIMASKK